MQTFTEATHEADSQPESNSSLLAAAKEMMQEPRKHAATRGRPRSLEAGRRLLKTTLDVVEECGYASFTVDEVARRSGIPKSTMYRRWDSKGEMLAEALFSEVNYEGLLGVESAGSLRVDLENYLRAVFETAGAMRYKQASLGVMVEAQLNPAVAAMLQSKILEPRRTALRELLERGVKRGELAADTDREVILDMLLGAIWYRTMLAHSPLDERLIADLVDVILTRP